jgi:DNA-binding response OmpR family regulator
MRHANRVCTREELLASVWGYDHDPGTNVVQVYVGYLRRKLALPGSPAPIETVRAVGYRLR